MVIPHLGVGHLRVTHPFATLTPRRIQGIPFDLHVLGTPPAFILSQDQTLRKFTFRVLTQARLGTQSTRVSSYHSSVVKVLPKRRRSISRLNRLVKSGIDFVHCLRTAFPDLTGYSCLSSRQEGIVAHSPAPVKSATCHVRWTQQPADSTLPICWLLRCDLGAAVAYGLRFPNSEPIVPEDEPLVKSQIRKVRNFAVLRPAPCLKQRDTLLSQ
jgi:hypothetical protein